MRIVIDLQGAQCGSRHRGIGRYSLSLAQAMIRHGGEHEFIIALSDLFPETIEPLRALFGALIHQENIRVWSAPGPVNGFDTSNNRRRHAAELIREAFLGSLEPDIVHVTSMVEGFDDNAVNSVKLLRARYATAVTFYDVIPLIQSEVYLKPNPLFESLYREKIGHLAKSDLFLAISESSRQEAIKYLGASPEKAIDIAAAADDSFHPLDISAATEAGLRQRLGLTKPFLMYSGATDERKNHLRLIKAFSLLPKQLRHRFQLALVGRLPGHHHQGFIAQVKACGLTLDDVVITGGVSDLEMQQLYNLCHLFIFPSWHEGFGLPALEAMACGAAVIGSNTTSVPEVIGRADALFDPFDEESIASKIQGVLVDEDFRQELKRHALIQSKTFSWERSAKIALEKFEKVHAARKNVVGKPGPVAPKGPLPTLVKRIAALEDGPAAGHELEQLATAIARNHPRLGERQLFVDVSELVQRDSRSGIQRVVRSVLLALLNKPPPGYSVEPVYGVPDAAGYRYARSFHGRFMDIDLDDEADELIEPHNGDIFLGLDLQLGVVLAQAGYLRSLRNIGVRVYFVVYDLIPVIAPWAYPAEWNQSDLHQRWLNVLQQQTGVLCISRSVADELVRWLDAFGSKRSSPLQIGWFHLGADVSQSLPSGGLDADAPTVLDTLSKRVTFLCVGTLEPRKGQEQMLDVFDLLWEGGADVNLVLVGKRGWNGDGWSTDHLVERLRSHPECQRRLFWLESISDEYLEAVYREADCLLAPSRAEGFGLPLIEAAHYGLSIVARDIPVFREVAGEHAFYFESGDNSAVAARINEWLALFAAGTAPSSKGMAWLTWEQSASQLLQVITRDRWYANWSPADHQRIAASDSRVGSQVGSRTEREVLSVGMAGWLIYGPYLPLQAGRYRVVVRGRVMALQPQGANVSVAMAGASRILAEAAVSAPKSLLDGAVASIIVVVPKNCSDLEVRVWVDADTRIAISLIDVSALDDPPYDVAMSEFETPAPQSGGASVMTLGAIQ